MKKILILIICLLLSAPQVFAQDRKRSSGVSRSAPAQNQRSSSGNASQQRSYNTTSSPSPRYNSNSSANNNDLSRRQSAVSAPASQSKNVKTVTPSALPKNNSSASSISKSVSPAVVKRPDPKPRNENRTRNNAIRKNSAARNNAVKSTRQIQKSNSPAAGIAKSNADVRRSHNVNSNARDYKRDTNNNRAHVNSYKYNKGSNHSSINRPPKRPDHRPSYRHYRPKTYYYRPSWFASTVSFLLFPFAYLSYHNPYYREHYYYTPHYAGSSVYYGYNNYTYYTSDKLSVDYTVLSSDTEEETGLFYDSSPEPEPELSGIKIQNTRLVTNAGNMIGFEINNGSKYDIASISFRLTIRGTDSTDTISGIFYKLETPLAPGEKEFYKIYLDDLDLDLPEAYTVFAEVESITTPSGSTIIDNDTAY